MESSPQPDQGKSTDSQSRYPTTAQVLLGLFIVWQLFFLIAGNALEVLYDAESRVPESLKPAAEQIAPGWVKQEGHFHRLTRNITHVTDAWAQMTGQSQSWSLFAPNVYRRCAFPALKIRWNWDAATVQGLAPQLSMLSSTNALTAANLLAAKHALQSGKPESAKVFLSDNEPNDISSFFRWQGFRLRRLESPITLYLSGDVSKPTEERKKRWRKEIREHVREYGGLMKAYLKWRYNAFVRRNPDFPRPTQVVLIMREYRIQPPDSTDGIWRGPAVFPVARWLPGTSPDVDAASFQRYNPVTERFESVSK